MRELLRCASVGVHAPDLHLAAAIRVVVDELSVGRIVRSVIESGTARNTVFLAATHVDRIDVEFIVATSYERECLTIRRPPMPEARGLGGDFSGYCSSIDRKDVEAG